MELMSKIWSETGKTTDEKETDRQKRKRFGVFDVERKTDSRN